VETDGIHKIYRWLYILLGLAIGSKRCNNNNIRHNNNSPPVYSSLELKSITENRIR
jgi:hypothetical protein